jgi:hypothetical protein
MFDPVVDQARSIITRVRRSLRDGNTRDAYVWPTYLPPGWFFGRHATSLNMFDAGNLAAEFDYAAQIIRRERLTGIKLLPASEVRLRSGGTLGPGRLSHWMPEKRARELGEPLGIY